MLISTLIILSLLVAFLVAGRRAPIKPVAVHTAPKRARSRGYDDLLKEVQEEISSKPAEAPAAPRIRTLTRYGSSEFDGRKAA